MVAGSSKSSSAAVGAAAAAAANVGQQMFEQAADAVVNWEGAFDCLLLRVGVCAVWWLVGSVSVVYMTEAVVQLQRLLHVHEGFAWAVLWQHNRLMYVHLLYTPGHTCFLV